MTNAGSPMLYELATSALQQLPQLVQEPPPYFALPPLGSGEKASGREVQGVPDIGTEPDQAMGQQPPGRGRERRPAEKRAYDAVVESRLLKEEMER